jgi:gliding motility-associated transport system ATP-binding protein
MPQSDIIVVERLVKRYGARLAVRGVSFAVKEGEIVGLLGPNGSGKSTILRILTGYLRSSSGSVRIGGVDVAEHAARNYAGYVPEDAPLYDWMRVGEFLQFMAAIKGVRGRAAESAIASVCAQLDLERVVGLTVGKLSRGYRQRVAIAQALLNNPPILVFDEPTNALDAYQVIGIRELIRSLAGQRTVLVASHVLTEIEKVASRIMILRDGDLLTADATSEGSRAPRFRMRIVGPRQAVLTSLRNVAGVVAAEVRAAFPESAASVTASYLVETASRPGIAEDMAQSVVGNGFALAELIEEKPDLERVFLDLTQRATEARAA